MKLRPGSLCTINRVVYRAKKRDSEHFLDCTGCDLNSPFSCPNIAFANCNNKITINCEDARIILKRIK